MYKDGKVILGMLLLPLLILSQATNVIAVNNQALDWGIEAGNRFNYDLEVTYHNATYSLDIIDKMYVIIDDLPVIPDNVSHLYEIAFYDFTTYWNNGTNMDNFWTNVMHFIPFYAIPTGNWSLISDLYGEVDPPVAVEEDKSTFKATWGPGEFYNSTQIAMMSDGVLVYLYTEWNRTGMEDFLTIKLNFEGYVLPTSTTTAISTTISNSTTTAVSTTTFETSTPTLVDGVNYYYYGFVITLIVIVTVILADKLRERGAAKPGHI